MSNKDLAKDLAVVEENETDIVQADDIDNMLQLPVNRTMVLRLADTLMGIHPAATEIGKVGMRTVAQLAIATGANPLPGTNGIHAWIDNKNKLCIQFGIGFWRSLVEVSGGMVWEIKPRPMTKEERANLGVQDGDVAFICAGSLNRDMIRLSDSVKRMGLPPLSYKELKAEVAHTGYGLARTEKWSNSGAFKEQKSGRPIGWTAELSAERDMYRKMVSVGGLVEKRQELNMKPPAWQREMLPEPKAPLPPTYDVDDFNDNLFGTSTTSKPVEIVDGEVETAVVIEASGVESSEDYWKTAVDKAKNIEGMAMALFQTELVRSFFGSAVQVKELLLKYHSDPVENNAMAEAARRYIDAVADNIEPSYALAHTRHSYLMHCQDNGHSLIFRGKDRDGECVLNQNMVEKNGKIQYSITIGESSYEVDPTRVCIDSLAF